MVDNLFPMRLYPSDKGGGDSFTSRGKETVEQLNQFWEYPIDGVNKLLQEKSATYWDELGKKNALAVFHAAADRVPAYKDFLRKNKVKASSIKSFKDFVSGVPVIDKENYLKKYDLNELVWEGDMGGTQMVSVSSGSSGEPFFWPRSDFLELETTYIQELLLNSFFEIGNKSTLYVNCFAMGMYIAGPIILNSALRVSQKGYPLMVITPGLAMDDIMRVVGNIGSNFDQVVIAGYPPYIKDVVEEGVQRRIDWKKMNLRLILAGEGFSEEWRDHVASMGGIKDAHRSIISMYGTADASIVGHETPASILLRRFIDRNESLKNDFLSTVNTSRLPTIVQYYPTNKYFESINNELHFTSSSSIPLIRYNIHDNGGVVSYEEAISKFKLAGVDMERALGEELLWKLPFMYLYGRSDFTVVLYGANIYPENIKSALETYGLRKRLTGRFLMNVEHDVEQNPVFNIHVELAGGRKITKKFEEKVKAVIIKILLKANNEYRSSHEAKGDRMFPIVQLHEKGDENYFARTNNKQQWTKKG